MDWQETYNCLVAMKEQGAEAINVGQYFEKVKWRKPTLLDANNWSDTQLMKFAESYHRHRLESITEERIEEIVDSEAMSFRELQIRCRGAEALLNHLKNEKTRKPIP